MTVAGHCEWENVACAPDFGFQIHPVICCSEILFKHGLPVLDQCIFLFVILHIKEMAKFFIVLESLVLQVSKTTGTGYKIDLLLCHEISGLTEPNQATTAIVSWSCSDPHMALMSTSLL